MAVRTIITAPDPRLKAVSKPVERVDAAIKKLVADMFETMYAEPSGVGLAAIQLGVARRVIVMDLAHDQPQKDPRVFINPKIAWRSDETVICQEGCLSVPDIWEDVERPARVRVEFLDGLGKAKILEADGMLATCIQHEMDHLEGVLFIDKLSRLKRDMALRKLAKARRLAAE